jgi:hypothetical protein
MLRQSNSMYCWIIREFEADVEIILQLTVNQSVYFGVEPTLELVSRYYFLSEGCCLKITALFLWSALSEQRTGLQFVVQSPSGPSRSKPVTILYYLI